VRDALNIGFDGEFVDKIDVRYTQDSRGQNFQVMFVHFLPKEGNEHTTRFFQRLEQNGEVNFYTGKTNRTTGERFYWKIRKIIKKERAEPVIARPGLMSEEDETKLVVSKHQAALPKLEEGEINEAEEAETEETETEEETEKEAAE
jgi:hypothetical protein